LSPQQNHHEAAPRQVFRVGIAAIGVAEIQAKRYNFNMALKRILSGRILVLKLSRLGHVPPGWYGTEILAEAGLPITVLEFSSENQGLKQREESLSSRFSRYRLGPRRWLRYLPQSLRAIGTLCSVAYFLIQSIRRADRPSFLIAHGLQEQVVALILHKLFRLPYAVHVHEVYEAHELRGLARVFFGLEGPSLREAELLIFPEKERAQIYSRRYHLKNRIHVVYNCPRLSRAKVLQPRRLRSEFNIPDDHLIVGYMGGVGRTNALIELVHALALVPKASLLVWGWADAKYRAQILAARDQHRLADRVRLLGEVEDKWGHLAGCDVLYCVYADTLLRTRHQATASNKFTEALACGVPVLAHASGGFPEALGATGGGIAVADLLPQSLAQALQRLQDPQFRATLGKQGRTAFLSQYHYERQFAPVLEALQNHLLTPPNPLKAQPKILKAAS
jgi:glycosyltransferase involved in cell wall biosynthesis